MNIFCLKFERSILFFGFSTKSLNGFYQDNLIDKKNLCTIDCQPISNFNLALDNQGNKN